jgi:hypothetical protein
MLIHFAELGSNIPSPECAILNTYSPKFLGLNSEMRLSETLFLLACGASGAEPDVTAALVEFGDHQFEEPPEPLLAP